MRRLLLSALSAAIMLGGIQLAQGQQPADGAAKKSSWLPSWLTLHRKAKKKEVEPEAEEAPPPSINPKLLQTRAYDEWLRRWEVCQRLREVAFQTNDRELEKKADDLDRQAKALLDERMLQITTGRINLAEEEKAYTRTLDSRPLNRLAGSSQPLNQRRGAQGTQAAQGAAREEEP